MNNSPFKKANNPRNESAAIQGDAKALGYRNDMVGSSKGKGGKSAEYGKKGKGNKSTLLVGCAEVITMPLGVAIFPFEPCLISDRQG